LLRALAAENLLEPLVDPHEVAPCFRHFLDVLVRQWMLVDESLGLV
jgi:hypothetical protein